MSFLRIGPREFSADLVIFDKDGTLIDFHHMWAEWVTTLARRLEQTAGIDLAAPLYRAMGYDAAAARVLPTGPLAAHSMAALRRMTVEVVRGAALTEADAERVVAQAWYVPDPVALARPIGNLPRLFSTLAALKIKIAVATSDDRAPTEATLAHLGILPFVDALIAADDPVPHKPAPDMILYLARTLNVPLHKTVMIGDAIADMQMGRAAGAGLVVGVSSGVSSAELLKPSADVVIASLDELIES